jgi:serine-type D-Ala-D-Ala carboxypeptidase/endopeptidase (penicillin-binding protein 4)
MNRIVVVFCVLLSILLAGDVLNDSPGAVPPPGTDRTDTNVDDAIKILENDKSMNGAQWSFCAFNLIKKTWVADKNSNLRLVPASILKVFTTISAYDIIGHQASFQTQLLYRGNIDTQGVLHGDLIIKGFGDPTIACDHFGKASSALTVFTKFKDAAQQAGIKSIDGRIVGDASVWGPMLQAPGYMWEDLGNYYGAGASSINYHENKLKVTFKPGKAVGDTAGVLFITPHPMQPLWVNTVKTAGSSTGDNVYIYGTPFQKIRYLTGTVPAGKAEFTVWASDPDPALRFAGDFGDFLTTNSISISQDPVSYYQHGWLGKDSLKLLCTHNSPSLKEISKWVNHKSHNVSAESVFRLLGIRLKKTIVWGETADALVKHWQSKGIATSNIIITDGSGLSRTNMITTKFLVDLLVYAHKESWFQDLYDILPVAGKDGTLKTNFLGTSVEGNMHGKSGLLKGVRSYTGYVTNKSGDLIAFAVIANGHMLSNSDIRKKLENLVVSLADSV